MFNSFGGSQSSSPVGEKALKSAMERVKEYTYSGNNNMDTEPQHGSLEGLIIKNEFIMSDYIMSTFRSKSRWNLDISETIPEYTACISKFEIPQITDPYQLERIENEILSRDSVEINYKGGVKLVYSDTNEHHDGHINQKITYCIISKGDKVLLKLGGDNYNSTSPANLVDFYKRMPEGGNFNIYTLEEVYYDLLEGAARESIEGSTRFDKRKLSFDYTSRTFKADMGADGSKVFATKVLVSITRKPGQDLRYCSPRGPELVLDDIMRNLKDILPKTTFVFADKFLAPNQL